MGNLLSHPRANPNDGSSSFPLGAPSTKRVPSPGFPGSLPRYSSQSRRVRSSSAGDLQQVVNADHLTAEQLRRRDAWRAVDAAYTGGAVFSPEAGYLRLGRRGVAGVAAASALGYYLLRLVIRDNLGGFQWYHKLEASVGRVHELYLLGIVNACLVSGFSWYKL